MIGSTCSYSVALDIHGRGGSPPPCRYAAVVREEALRQIACWWWCVEALGLSNPTLEYLEALFVRLNSQQQNSRQTMEKTGVFQLQKYVPRQPLPLPDPRHQGW